MSAEYEPLEIIGRGSFGLIRRVRRLRDGEILVRKEVAYKTMNPKERAQLIGEFRILKSLNHPNIVHYLHHQHVPETQEVHLYMEYCSGGDLARFIRSLAQSGSYAPETQIWDIVAQLLQALYRCHYNEAPPPPVFGSTPAEHHIPQSFILHRDLKPENIFLDSEGNIKLGDFGLAKLLEGEKALAQTYVGTPYYMSPEVLMNQPSTPASDVWSLGCVIYELCALHPPFQAQSHIELSERIKEGKFEQLPLCYSSALRQTVLSCLNLKQDQRPTTATLLNLNVVTLKRKERELMHREQLVLLQQQRLELQEAALREKVEQIKERMEQTLEAEVNRRLEERLRVSPGRQVRGPRVWQDGVLSPLQNPSRSDSGPLGSPISPPYGRS